MRMSNAGMDSHAMPHDFLVVTLGADEYAFDVARVLEIRPFEHSPREQRRDGTLPEISTWKGVKASVLDMRIAWGCETPEYDACAAIVLLDASEPISEQDQRILSMVTESGRALVAHHSVLIYNVLATNEILAGQVPESVGRDEHPVIRQLSETYEGISRKNFQEGYHDALQIKEEAITAFNLGFLDLKARARVEELFWATCEKILKIVRDLPYVPDELEGLEKHLSDTYYCNFSLFQSLPDHWAVRQLFPTMPIERLNKQPTRRAILADLTCDSDGKMDRFIDLRDVKDYLELHPLNGEPYYVGSFLVGAYQEILGDLHNLFGDTNTVHVSLDEEDDYRIEGVINGDTVTDVLRYVRYNREELVAKVRRATEAALKAKRMTFEESKTLLRRYEEGLAGYTYLEQD